MFAVPEVGDNTQISSTIENPKPSIESETSKECSAVPLSLLTTSDPISSTEKNELIKPEIPPPPPPPPIVPASKQHRSRLSLFHRNTIHVCDQIVDRV